MANDKKEAAQSWDNVFLEINTRIRDLEEKQGMLRDRLLLVGQNLIEIKEKTNDDIIEIKKNLETMKNSIERMASFLEIVSGELQKFAKKEDLELLSKKIRMSQALEIIERNKNS